MASFNGSIRFSAFLIGPDYNTLLTYTCTPILCMRTTKLSIYAPMLGMTM